MSDIDNFLTLFRDVTRSLERLRDLSAKVEKDLEEVTLINATTGARLFCYAGTQEFKAAMRRMGVSHYFHGKSQRWPLAEIKQRLAERKVHP